MMAAVYQKSLFMPLHYSRDYDGNNTKEHIAASRFFVRRTTEYL